MDTGAVDVTRLAGGMDLGTTLESGQSYRWRRADGRAYETASPAGTDAWYHTVLPARHTPTNEPEVLRIRQADERLVWEAGFDAEQHLRRRLRLDDDLEAIRSTVPDVSLVEQAFAANEGLRLVRDPPFGTLISFICSTQMRVARIHGMQTRLARTLGDRVTFGGETYHAFPRPDQLAATTEATLRDLGLGYRAPYVLATAERVADGADRPETAADRPYEDARAFLTRFDGVGEKVADCVLLFSLDYLEAVPLDTWIRTAIAEYFPDCARDSYESTSRAIRERFGGEYAGYTQTYVFHFLRTTQRST